MRNALPILLLGGAALLLMSGKKKYSMTIYSDRPSTIGPPIPSGTFGPKKSYSPKSGSSSGYPNVSRNQMVEIQNKLVALGFSVGPKGPDGLYGPATKDAVLAFQKKYMTQAQGWDGKPGPTTRGVLDAKFNALSPQQKTNAEGEIAVRIKELAKTKAPVIEISTDSYFQKFYNTTETGVFLLYTSGKRKLYPDDPETEEYAKNYSEYMKSVFDGIAIANAGKARFARADVSSPGLVIPLSIDYLGVSFPNAFPILVGVSGGKITRSYGLVPSSHGVVDLDKMISGVKKVLQKTMV